MNIESRESFSSHNLLSNFDETVELIKQIEGTSWYRSYITDVKTLVERMKNKAELNPDEIFDGFYGDGGVTRWMVMGDGEVRFSKFHDTGGEKVKTKIAEGLGFKVI